MITDKSFCEAVGANPNDNALLKCNMSSPSWTKALFDTMLDPTGIDWWWTDSEGCVPPTPAKIALPNGGDGYRDNALIWSNMVYSSMIDKTGLRPLVLSRYGGIGNQRYGIGFSGDTESAWPTLKYQVEMTSTAANVLQAYWSHDIGGYNVYCPANPGVITPCGSEKVVVDCNLTLGTCKKADGELFTRWLQFGALSPILRTHCSHCDHRIWAYPGTQFAAMKAAMLFRNALIPYLYTAARYAYDHAVAAVHPLYYDWDLPEAYEYASAQYMLGDTLMAAPITATVINYTSAQPYTSAAPVCTPGKYLGCFDSHLPKIEPRFVGGDGAGMTVERCASLCHPGIETHMAISSSSPAPGSQCRCGSVSPPSSRAIPSSNCSIGCSGNRSQTCGGKWAASIYALVCPPAPPPPPQAPDSPATDIWIPPGVWFPWNTSAALRPIGGPAVLRGLRFALSELPLFALAGSVIPTQTMRRENGPLVWVIFPGTAGNGSHYEDDGNSTRYQQPSADEGGFSTSTLTHTMSEHNVVGGHGGGTLRQTVIISGPTGPPRRHLLQLRRIAGSQGAPISVECDGVALSALPPPATEADLGAATGWWVTPKANDSLWLAGGSLMVSLPQKIGDINATLVY